MKRTECIRPEEWGAVEAAGASDPRRRHVEECARCQAQRSAYLELIQDRGVPSGADPRAASLAMRRAFEAELERNGATSKRARLAKSSGTSARGVTARVGDFLFTRPAFAAFAAVATLAVIWVAFVPPEGRAPRDVLRGGDRATPAPWTCSVEVRSGALEFTWTAVPDADAYDVLLFDRDLREIHRAGPFAADARSARLDAREAALVASPPSYWQVVARAGADTVASSPVRRLDR